jgi:hypothetical protein
MAQAVEVLATLTQRWRDLPADSVQAAEARKHRTAKQSDCQCCEALELESGLTREEEPARQAQTTLTKSTRNIASSITMPKCGCAG